MDFYKQNRRKTLFVDHFAINSAVHSPYTLLLLISCSLMRTFCSQFLIKLANMIFIFETSSPAVSYQ